MNKTVNEMLEQKVSELCGKNNELRSKVDEILSLQRQVDIEPMEVFIGTEEVRQRHKITGAMEFIKCDTKICFHTPYFWVISEPSLANNLKGGALYETLEWLCEYKNSREEYDEKARENYDTFVNVIVSLLALPLDVFTDIDYTLDVATVIMEKRAEYFNRIAEEAEAVRKDTIESINKNLEFEAAIEAEDKVLKG